MKIFRNFVLLNVLSDHKSYFKIFIGSCKISLFIKLEPLLDA